MLFPSLWILVLLALSLTAEGATVHIAFLGRQPEDIRPAAANLEPLYPDIGLRGAELGIEDNDTTGRFTGQAFKLLGGILERAQDPKRAFYFLLKEGYHHIIVNLPARDIVALADMEGTDQVLLYNAGAYDDRLRGAECRPNVLHTLPSHAMRADALGQYLKTKRWEDWFLVPGQHRQDQLFASAIQRTAKRFGMKLVAKKPWTHDFDARRTAQSLVATFTQGVDYDILLIADEAGLFGDYFPYRTWLPRPVAGTQGLIATAWHPAHEQWGAVQLQNRFRERAGRWMKPRDYAAWLAVRAIGEAATRTGSTRFTRIREFLLSHHLALAGFKGRPLSFRLWNGQLRQPILLSGPRTVVAVAPLEGFLHPVDALDTLGYDERESRCHLTRK